MAKKPQQEITPQDQQTLVPKKQGALKKPNSAHNASNTAKREARLAEALRANLRRRKLRGTPSGEPDQGGKVQDERED